jgi:hypothetical protein
MKQIISKKLLIWFLLTINLLFAFIIGITIPMLESASFLNLGLVMIPLLIVINYVLLDRFRYYLKHSNNEEGDKDADV